MADLTPGTRVGPYEIVEFIAAGGMGEVYRGNDTRLGRSVAIKILPESAFGDEYETVIERRHPVAAYYLTWLCLSAAFRESEPGRRLRRKAGLEG
jgi:serine/threonine protein kinase